MVNFRLYTGGPFGLSIRRRHDRPSSPLEIWICAVALGLPLLISKLIEAPQAIFQMEPWLRDLPSYVRLLGTLPLLIYSGTVLDSRSSKVLNYLQSFSNQSRNQVENAVNKALRARDSLWINLPVLSVALILLFHRIEKAVSNHEWSHFHDVWFSIVCQLITQTVLLIWLMRTLIWTYLLWIFSQTELHINPSHPDGRGGLGFLNWVQAAFSWATLGFASLLVVELLGTGGEIDQTQLIHTLKILGVFLIFSFGLYLGPLFFFTPQLCRAKDSLRMDYHFFSNQCVETYQRKWIQSRDSKNFPEESILTPDISAIGDLMITDRQVCLMKVVIPDPETVQRFIIAGLIPLVPALLAQIPAKVWLKILEKILL